MYEEFGERQQQAIEAFERGKEQAQRVTRPNSKRKRSFIVFVRPQLTDTPSGYKVIPMLHAVDAHSETQASVQRVTNLINKKKFRVVNYDLEQLRIQAEKFAISGEDQRELDRYRQLKTMCDASMNGTDAISEVELLRSQLEAAKREKDELLARHEERQAKKAGRPKKNESE